METRLKKRSVSQEAPHRSSSLRAGGPPLGALGPGRKEWATLSSLCRELQDSQPGLFLKHEIVWHSKYRAVRVGFISQVRRADEEGGRTAPSPSWGSHTTHPPGGLTGRGLLWSTYHGVAQKEDRKPRVVFLHNVHMLQHIPDENVEVGHYHPLPFALSMAN